MPERPVSKDTLRKAEVAGLKEQLKVSQTMYEKAEAALEKCGIKTGDKMGMLITVAEGIEELQARLTVSEQKVAKLRACLTTAADYGMYPVVEFIERGIETEITPSEEWCKANAKRIRAALAETGTVEAEASEAQGKED